MKFGYSAETSSGIEKQLNFIFGEIAPLLKKKLERFQIEAGEVELLYVPIIMHSGDKERYPARSCLKRGGRVFNCCPQLDFEVFKSRCKTAILEEYFRGLNEVPSALKKLGATSDEISQFQASLVSLIEEFRSND